MKSTSRTGPAPSAPPRTAERSPALLLLGAAGVLLLAGAALHNPWTVGLAVRAAGAIFHRPFLTPAPALIHHAQLVYLAAGALVLACVFVIGRVPALARFFRRAWVEKATLALVVVALPLAWLEIGLRPFAQPRGESTTIFARDETLGWTLRPGAVDEWGGVEVRINPRGLRGPVVPYARTPGTRRIVYLGDSVTFGYLMPRWEDTYPYALADSLAARDGIPVETVNLSVDGYSQWQQYIVLSSEGAKYAPDLVVVGFVLNDVTEMFHLARFGGTGEGYQLRHTQESFVQRVLARSALFTELQGVVREVKARRRLGDDLRLGAIRQEQLDVESLMRSPEAPAVRTAWDIALADLQRIVDWCGARDVPVLVVVFPFTVQLDDPAGLAAPQQTIVAYAHARGIPVVDLLPLLVEYNGTTGTRPSDLFVDHDHLSQTGHRVVAGLLAERVAAMLARP